MNSGLRPTGAPSSKLQATPKKNRPNEQKSPNEKVHEQCVLLYRRIRQIDTYFDFDKLTYLLTGRILLTEILAMCLGFRLRPTAIAGTFVWYIFCF